MDYLVYFEQTGFPKAISRFNSVLYKWISNLKMKLLIEMPKWI